MNRLMLSTAVLLMVLSPALPAAETPRYGDWQGADERLLQLVDELQIIVDEGRTARAGHPAFLDDLQQTLDRYRVPRRVLLLGDDFRDGDYSAAPAWSVVEGRWEVEPGGWLHSATAPPAADTARGDESQRDRNVRLLIGILGELSRDKGSGGTAESLPTRAVIRTEVGIDNAFTVELTLDGEGGTTAVAVVQGASLQTGYRLVHGVDGSWELFRYRRGVAESLGRSTASAPSGSDASPRKLTWRRAQDGTMTVGVDGTSLLEVRDLTYRQPFDGIALINDGGDWRYGELAVYAER